MVNNFDILRKQMDKRQQAEQKYRGRFQPKIYYYACDTYQPDIHFCKRQKRWINIDQGNLVVLKGNTEESVQCVTNKDVYKEVYKWNTKQGKFGMVAGLQEQARVLHKEEKEDQLKQEAQELFCLMAPQNG